MVYFRSMCLRSHWIQDRVIICTYKYVGYYSSQHLDRIGLVALGMNDPLGFNMPIR